MMAEAPTTLRDADRDRPLTDYEREALVRMMAAGIEVKVLASRRLPR